MASTVPSRVPQTVGSLSIRLTAGYVVSAVRLQRRRPNDVLDTIGAGLVGSSGFVDAWNPDGLDGLVRQFGVRREHIWHLFGLAIVCLAIVCLAVVCLAHHVRPSDDQLPISWFD